MKTLIGDRHPIEELDTSNPTAFSEGFAKILRDEPGHDPAASATELLDVAEQYSPGTTARTAFALTALRVLSPDEVFEREPETYLVLMQRVLDCLGNVKRPTGSA